jgi:hypothetical protein
MAMPPIDRMIPVHKTAPSHGSIDDCLHGIPR